MFRGYEQRPAKQRMPSQFGRDFNRQIVFRISANVEIGLEGLLVFQIDMDAIPQRIENFRSYRLVNFAPVDGIRCRRLIDKVAILR